MNAIQRGVIALMKSAVTGQEQLLPEMFDLSDAESYIRKHQLATLAYDGASRCGIGRQHPVMISLRNQYYKALQVSEGQLRELRRIYDAFEKAEIDYMPLKGSRLKNLYPKPELRVMGDADILIRMDQYKEVQQAMQALGFQEGNETDHELIWQSNGLHLELHKRLIPSYDSALYTYYGDGWSFAKTERATRFAMIPEDEFVYLFTHFAKHYRNGGIGCRHVLDLWVYRKAHPQMNEEYTLLELNKMHLGEFYKNTIRMLDVWFEGAQEEPKTEFMTEFIFSSGSWGKMESRVLSQALRNAHKTTANNNGKITYLLKRAFPPVQTLRGKYTILKTCPFLLPVIWLIRPFYKFLFERYTLKRISEDVKVITQEKIQEQEHLLEYVGLNFKQ